MRGDHGRERRRAEQREHDDQRARQAVAADVRPRAAPHRARPPAVDLDLVAAALRAALGHAPPSPAGSTGVAASRPASGGSSGAVRCRSLPPEPARRRRCSCRRRRRRAAAGRRRRSWSSWSVAASARDSTSRQSEYSSMSVGSSFCACAQLGGACSRPGARCRRRSPAGSRSGPRRAPRGRGAVPRAGPGRWSVASANSR